jgi:tetratricopeptide (TPR) repeat protein
MDGMSDPQQPNTSPSDQAQTQPVKTRRSVRWVWLGVLLFLLIIVSGVYLGYRNGIDQRLDKETSQVVLLSTEQFQRGLLDMQSGNYELARRRFEYVIQLDPNFPGATEKLAEVMLAMNRTATPTLEPTPTVVLPTPTPDTRNIDQLFAEAKQLLVDKEWQKAIDTIEVLRKANLQYRSVEVDGFYYIALRNLGVQKILMDGELENGIYDLALAERFGPLDAEADSYRIWAQYYITGASFWEVDWSQVVFYFSQVYPALPNLRNGGANGMTAIERYRLGSIKYGDKLAAAGEWCKAKEQYANALSLGTDPQLEPTASFAVQKCEESTNPATQTPPAQQRTPTPATQATPTISTQETPTLQPTDIPTTEITPPILPTNSDLPTNAP